jgi:hypothetical protein
MESEEMNDSAWRALLEETPPSIDDNNIGVTAASSDGTTLRTKVESSMDLQDPVRSVSQGHHVL